MHVIQAAQAKEVFMLTAILIENDSRDFGGCIAFRKPPKSNPIEGLLGDDYPHPRTTCVAVGAGLLFTAQAAKPSDARTLMATHDGAKSKVSEWAKASGVCGTLEVFFTKPGESMEDGNARAVKFSCKGEKGEIAVPGLCCA